MKKHKHFSFGKVFAPHGSGFDAVPYDPDRQIPVIRSSICTGEKVAGFKSREDGHFTEVMLIRSPKDIEAFREQYGVESIKTEY